MPNREVKLDRRTHSLTTAIAKATAELGIEWMVMGAAARMLLLEHVYGLAPGRGTEDIDLGVMVASWKDYRALIERLRTTGLKPDPKQRQRLIRDDAAIVDLVPFGDIESNEKLIRWPPENEIAMTVLGFREAYANTETVSVEGVAVRVVNPIGLMLLKLIAWKERHIEQPKKDASDIAYLIRHFAMILGQQALFDEHQTAMEAADYDPDIAAAYVLGTKIAGIAANDTRTFVTRMLDDELRNGIDSLLVREVTAYMPATSNERVHQLIASIGAGLLSLELLIRKK